MTGGEMAITKREAAELPESAWNRTADDEPVFVLCGRDAIAPQVVREWSIRALHAGVPSDKVKTALDVADRMYEWQEKHGKKLPDHVPGEQS
jgi:hypothetical protein